MSHKPNCAVYDPCPSSCDCGYSTLLLHAPCRRETEQLQAKVAEQQANLRTLELLNENYLAKNNELSNEAHCLERKISEQQAEITRLKTVPMKYRRMGFTAQLQKENADLQFRNDRLAQDFASVPEENNALRRIHAENVEILTQQLAASQLSEKRLRSNISDCLSDLEGGFVRCERCGDQEDTATLDVVPILREALATPSSTEALDAYVADIVGNVFALKLGAIVGAELMPIADRIMKGEL